MPAVQPGCRGHVEITVPGHVTEQGDTWTLAKNQQQLLQESWNILGKEGAS